MSKREGNQNPRAVVLNVVGLCQRHLGPDTPRLTSLARSNERMERVIRPAFPALTCTAQASYLTGKTPSEHGIVGNGWYDRTLNEHHFWKQSNQLVKGEKLWESIRHKREDFRCANLFWWYNMYSSVDYSVTPRPLYGSDGKKVFDIHSQPLDLRRTLKADLGEFPFPAFWGPTAGIASSQWIADSARWVEETHQPDLSLVYLPHLDYDLQRFGPNDPKIKPALRAIDQVAGDLIDFFEARKVRVVVLSEYGITEVNRTIYPNRIFRHQGWLSIKEEFGLDTIDCGSSQAFALTDHQIAHVYIPRPDPRLLKKVRASLESMDGVASVLEGEARQQAGLDHERSGDLVAVAEEDAWFAYYHWEDDDLAPEFARCIDIHRKYGYDPAELFVDPKILMPKLRAIRKLIAKKMGFRIHMDLIPLQAGMVKGSHGVIPKDENDWPILFGKDFPGNGKTLEATDVRDLLLDMLSS